MSEITRVMLMIVRVGVDLAKNLIQVHAVDAAGRRVVARALKRDQFRAWCEQLPKNCLLAMECHSVVKVRNMEKGNHCGAQIMINRSRSLCSSGIPFAYDPNRIILSGSYPCFIFKTISSIFSLSIIENEF